MVVREGLSRRSYPHLVVSIQLERLIQLPVQFGHQDRPNSMDVGSALLGVMAVGLYRLGHHISVAV